MDTSATERLAELLAERMERQLTQAERAELDALLAGHPDWAEDDLELAAAAVELALSPSPAPLPEGLREALLADSEAYAPAGVVDLSRVRAERSASWVAWSGWAAAAAIFVFFAVAGDPVTDPGSMPAPVIESPSVAERRAALAARPETVRLAWSGTEDPLAKGVEGDVVWSPAAQEGYMRFKGLAANDPNAHQYQLWIFDAERNEAHPVDGGVFDSDGGEVVVPIDARVPVGEATLFAVTLERPGGVVVSSRERLVLIAKPG